jgi:hypothetical protein
VAASEVPAHTPLRQLARAFFQSHTIAAKISAK